MNLIACVDKNWCIGKNGDMLFHIREDLSHFKQKTVGNVCVMGYKTLLSLPSKKPLKNRENIVLTTKEIEIENATVCHNLDELFEVISQKEKDEGKKVFVIGGGKIYQTLLPYCEGAIITKVDDEVEGDTFMPNLDRLSTWRETETEKLTDFATICNFENLNVKKYSFEKENTL